MNPDLRHVASMYKVNGDLFNKTIRDIPADRWFERPGDGSDHLLWIVGHIAVHRGMALKTLGVEWSAPWQNLFAEGAARVGAEKYPKADAILREFEKISGQLPAALESASTDLLNRPAPPNIPALDGKLGGTVAVLAWHEGFHLGQAAYLRKWLGYSPV